MDIVPLLILAVIQGLTEFLPVSSSGHLVLMQYFAGFATRPGPTLELVLHGGTLLSIIYFYRQRIWELAIGLWRREREPWVYAGYLLISCFPAAIIYFLAGEKLDIMFESPLSSALFLLCTGAFLLSLRWLPLLQQQKMFSLPRVLAIALAQAIAMLPGISRSGSTIVTARWLGIGGKEAAEFSFLMSIPVLAGGILLKGKDILALSEGSGDVCSLLLACLVAASVGIAALKILSWCQLLGRFWWFGVYCLALGLVSSILILC